MSVRYEFRVEGWLSERARGAFSGMRIESIPRQTIISVEVTDQADLCDLLGQCSVMGIPVVSVRQLPDTSPSIHFEHAPKQDGPTGDGPCADTDER